MVRLFSFAPHRSHHSAAGPAFFTAALDVSRYDTRKICKDALEGVKISEQQHCVGVPIIQSLLFTHKPDKADNKLKHLQ